jgi:hypothetical protein
LFVQSALHIGDEARAELAPAVERFACGAQVVFDFGEVGLQGVGASGVEEDAHGVGQGACAAQLQQRGQQQASGQVARRPENRNRRLARSHGGVKDTCL